MTETQEFPVYFKLKGGGYMEISKDGDFKEISEKHCILHFVCGNRYIKRFRTDILTIRDYVLRDINAFKRVNKEISREDFYNQVDKFDERFKKAQNGEMKEQFLEESEPERVADLGPHKER